MSDAPSGATPSIVVSGPDGYRAAPTATGTLVTLVPGSYVVSAEPVAVSGATYYPSVSGSPATVVAGQVAHVTVSYLDEVLDTTKAVPVGVAADLCGVSGSTLSFSVGGTVPPVLAGLQVGDVLAFGPSATTPNGPGPG